MKIAILACALLIAAAPADRTAEDLAWLSGAWVAERDGRWTEERWTPPRGGVMLGTTLTGRGGKASGFEFMRIAPDTEGKLTFWGSPGGKPAVPFRLVAVSASQATFENPKHDFPTRISYRRSGKLLTATVSGPGGRNPESWTYRRR